MKQQVVSTTATLLALLVALSQGQSMYRKPLIYIAGPDQLSLIEDGGGFRFGYQALNQFRAEHRYPNGTVVGYYGYIGADGKPVRVSYVSNEEQGFQTSSEEIPLEFTHNSAENTNENIIEQKPAINEVTSDDNDSISIIAEGFTDARKLERNTRALPEFKKMKFATRKQLKKEAHKEKKQQNKLAFPKKWFHNIKQKMAKKQKRN